MHTISEQMSEAVHQLQKKYAVELNEKIKKVCDRSGWRFCCGGGIWYFESKSGKTADYISDECPMKIGELIKELVRCDQVLKYFVSNYCQRYTPITFSKTH